MLGSILINEPLGMRVLQRSHETFTRSLATDIITVRADAYMWSSCKAINMNGLKFKMHNNPIIMAEERKMTSANSDRKRPPY
jgi:hypothetical protein